MAVKVRMEQTYYNRPEKRIIRSPERKEYQGEVVEEWVHGNHTMYSYHPLTEEELAMRPKRDGYAKAVLRVYHQPSIFEEEGVVSYSISGPGTLEIGRGRFIKANELEEK